MKIQKYSASDMRSALRKVRAAHGPDVVILETRRADGMVELTIATDAEAAANAGSLTHRIRAAGGASVPLQRPTGTPLVAPSVQTVSLPVVAPVATTVPSSAQAPVLTGVTGRDASARDADIRPLPHPAAAMDVAAGVASGVDGELKALRRLLETQLAALAWNDLTRRAPVAAELMRLLAELGLERGLAASIVDEVPPGHDLQSARRTAFELLRSRLATTGDRWVEQGGTLVFVGPAGAGKTTALMSLAARWILRHGAEGAALVCAGDARFGAYEHLARIGRLLGLPTYCVDDLADLPALLARLGDRRLVLVDTAAAAARGPAADATSEALSALRGTAEIVVTLPATTQVSTLRSAASRYARLGASACIATRLDEATTLGGLVSCVVEAGLSLAYVTEGTRIPDDLRPARADDIVALAVSLAERHGATADEELLARRLGGRVHAAG
jgi:flagellar biosynthesis protein FlhF